VLAQACTVPPSQQLSPLPKLSQTSFPLHRQRIVRSPTYSTMS
jgi:hypothetical protein